jgi:hypothetical protein
MKVCPTIAPLVLLVTAMFASAQQPATTVQLPTFSQFTVRTTVSVPDGGTAYLGGIDRGVDSSVTRGLGPLRNRGIGSGRSASGVSVSATIIDHAEIDRAILAAAAGSREATTAADMKARAITSALPRSATPATGSAGSALSSDLPGSVAAIRAANAALDEQRAQEVKRYLTKAEQAEAAGKTSVAKVYYQMVARRGSGQDRQVAAERLAALTRASQSK